MSPMLTAIPQAVADNGLPVAIAFALAVTALVATGMAVAAKLKRVRLSRTVVGIAAGSALAVLVGALLVGGALTRPPAAVADVDNGGRSLAVAPPAMKLIPAEGLQLPTL